MSHKPPHCTSPDQRCCDAYWSPASLCIAVIIPGFQTCLFVWINSLHSKTLGTEPWLLPPPTQQRQGVKYSCILITCREVHHHGQCMRGGRPLTCSLPITVYFLFNLLGGSHFSNLCLRQLWDSWPIPLTWPLSLNPVSLPQLMYMRHNHIEIRKIWFTCAGATRRNNN